MKAPATHAPGATFDFTVEAKRTGLSVFTAARCVWSPSEQYSPKQQVLE